MVPTERPVVFQDREGGELVFAGSAPRDRRWNLTGVPLVFCAQTASNVGSGPAGRSEEIFQEDFLFTFRGFGILLGEVLNDLMRSVHRECLFHNPIRPLCSLERQSFRQQK